MWRKWLRFLKKSERGQASLEYAGMIAAAGILIAVIIASAQGWGDTLVCKISGAISGSGAGCSTSASAQGFAPDKVIVNENTVKNNRKTGITVPSGMASVGTDYKQNADLKFREFDDGSVVLSIDTSKGASLNGSIGKDLKYGELSASGEVGGAFGNLKEYRCEAGDGDCIAKLKEVAENAARTLKLKGLERLTDANGKEITPSADWEYKQIELEGKGKAKFGNKPKGEDASLVAEVEAGITLNGKGQWAEDKRTGNKKQTISGTFDASANGQLGKKAKIDRVGKDGTTVSLTGNVTPSIYADAGYKGSFQIVTERNKEGEPTGIKLITSRELNANAGVNAPAVSIKGQQPGDKNPTKFKQGLHGQIKGQLASSTAITTTTLKLDDIKDPALRQQVRDQINGNMLTKNPIETAKIIQNGGMYETDPGANANPVAQALYQNGKSTTQSLSSDKYNGEAGWDILVAHDQMEWAVDNREVNSTQYLSEPDPSGKRHMETYEPKP